VLARHQVQYVIVGGWAAIQNGPCLRRTDDLDIRPEWQQANLDRLGAALRELRAMPVSDANNGSCRPRAHSLAGAVFTDGSAAGVLERRAARRRGGVVARGRRPGGTSRGPIGAAGRMLRRQNAHPLVSPASLLGWLGERANGRLLTRVRPRTADRVVDTPSTVACASRKGSPAEGQSARPPIIRPPARRSAGIARNERRLI
jgi:hypothetical protein